MSLFIDASALIAIIAGEEDAGDLERRLEQDSDRYASPVSIWETVAGLTRRFAWTVPQARAVVDDFTDALAVTMIPVGREETEVALHAYETYGKGRHPAALNMGDCFAYACTRTSGARLLCKGNDFTRTDIVLA